MKLAEAKRLIAFLTSPAIQQAIGAFKRNQFGEPRFFPDAAPALRR